MQTRTWWAQMCSKQPYQYCFSSKHIHDCFSTSMEYSVCWLFPNQTCLGYICVLESVFVGLISTSDLRENDRRSNDLNYLARLNRARVGMLSDHDIGTLKSRLSCLFVQNHAQCSLHELLLMNTTCDVCITYLHISIQLQLSTCSPLMIPILMHHVRESLYQQMIETQEACLLFYKFPLVPGYAYS